MATDIAQRIVSIATCTEMPPPHILITVCCENKNPTIHTLALKGNGVVEVNEYFESKPPVHKGNFMYSMVLIINMFRTLARPMNDNDVVKSIEMSLYTTVELQTVKRDLIIGPQRDEEADDHYSFRRAFQIRDFYEDVEKLYIQFVSLAVAYSMVYDRMF